MLSSIYKNVRELFFSSVVDEHFNIAVPLLPFILSLNRAWVGTFFFRFGWIVYLFLRPLQILHGVVDF